MIETTQAPKNMPDFSETLKNKIDQWTAKFPPDQKQSAVLPALMLVQTENGGWLSDVWMQKVADYLEMPYIAVYEVAAFYHMYELKPAGKYKISICTNISCMLAGSEKIVDYLKEKLKIDFNQTTLDKKFTLKEAECLGACVNAPMMYLDNQYHENLTPEKAGKILDDLA